MHLVYIYNSFIFNLFFYIFNFSASVDTYLRVYKVSISSWTFEWEDRGDVHVRIDFLDMLKG